MDWSHWWYLERDPYLQLRERVRARSAALPEGMSGLVRAGVPVSRKMIDEVVLPALITLLQGERSDDMISSALIASARIGAGKTGRHRAGILAGIRMHLGAPSQELSETAVLSLGVLGDPLSLDILLAILDDTPAGASYLGRGTVPERSQAFAAFGLGAMAFDSGDVATRQRIALALVDVLSERHARPDLPVAAMMALGHCELPERLTLPPRDLLDSEHVDVVVSQSALVRWLLDRANMTIQDGLVASVEERSFHYVALARLGGAADEGLRDEVIECLISKANDPKEQSIERSAAYMALGQIVRAGDGKRHQGAIRELVKALRSGQPMERRFAAIALAQASSRPGLGDDPLQGAHDGRRGLEGLLMRGGATERPWAAIALGVQADGLAAAGMGRSGAAASGLAETLRKSRNATEKGAFALGLALACADVDDKVRARHGRTMHKAFQRASAPDARGHLAVALGLLNEQEARADLREVLQTSTFQPLLLWSTAVGLGLLGDDEVAPLLVDILSTSRSHSSRAAAAIALGTVGDGRAAQPLVELATDVSRPDTTRAFAIVGLGVLCEERLLPWRNPMAQSVPYTALTATLIGKARGLFDIL